MPVIKYVLTSFLLVLAGSSFAYFIALPASLYFLKQLSPTHLVSLITTEAYTSFIARYLIGFALLFQLPLVMLLINSFYKLSIKKLLSIEKWVILAAFTFAAILTPTPDIINQLIMAIPIIVLYQISLFVVFVTNKRR
jgi:sec-independent protein translocase protein TatC